MDFNEQNSFFLLAGIDEWAQLDADKAKRTVGPWQRYAVF